MAVSINYNGNTFSIPQYGNTGWAQNPGNLTLYLIALASGLSGWNSDITILPAGSGVIVTDATNGHTYRILVNNGVISTQLVS